MPNFCNYEIRIRGKEEAVEEFISIIQAESERLHISIEVFSSEPGCAFMEHYIYNNGDCIADECEKWEEYCTEDFKSVEALNEEFGTNFSQEEFEENDFLTVGGLDWEFDTWIN